MVGGALRRGSKVRFDVVGRRASTGLEGRVSTWLEGRFDVVGGGALTCLKGALRRGWRGASTWFEGALRRG